jgi:hypothetical protein
VNTSKVAALVALLVSVVVAAVAVTIYAFSSMPGGGGGRYGEPGATETTHPGAREVRVEMSDFRFEPSVVTVGEGEPVNLQLVNAGLTAPHLHGGVARNQRVPGSRPRGCSRGQGRQGRALRVDLPDPRPCWGTDDRMCGDPNALTNLASLHSIGPMGR